jgi:hypothetical protein
MGIHRFLYGSSSNCFRLGLLSLESKRPAAHLDRLPITFGFMGLLSAIIAERIAAWAGKLLLPPLTLIGAASVFYWSWTGDLRPYLFVQFFPILVLPLMLAWFEARYTRGQDFVIAIVWYGIAKVCELLDKQIFSVGSFMSGHTLKHLAASLSAFWIVRMLRSREIIGAEPHSMQASAAMH